jgi:hypothetical protein
MLAEEQVRDLHLYDGRDLSVELEGICACMDMIGGECAVEARKLS